MCPPGGQTPQTYIDFKDTRQSWNEAIYNSIILCNMGAYDNSNVLYFIAQI